MRIIWIALTAVLLAGCAVVPLFPYAYVPAPAPRSGYAYPSYPRYAPGPPYGRWEGR
jgi:hypothetical protein